MNLAELPWLPPAAPDLAAAVRALRADGGWDAATFRRLATARLNLQQLTTLARALPADDAALPAPALRLAVLSNATTDLLLPALAATGPRHGLWLRPQAPPFGTALQEALDPQSATQRSRPQAVLLALDHRAFDLAPCLGDPAAAEARVDAALQQLDQAAAALQAGGGASVVLQTLAPPPEAVFGHLELQLPGTTGALVDAFNRRLRQARRPGTLLLDVAALAAGVGTARWHDPALWHLGKFACAQAVVPLLAEHLCRVLAAACGQRAKCLVLDLDNTLWGGVIGDDGLAGIVLGQGSPVGEAHLAVQQAALALRARGVLLAVSSKNDDAVARQAFREHPDMLLREEHIAAFQANWQDKASNLRAIARTLNIGVDALVLLDDHPAERQQVRLALPEVMVPELPDGPDDFAALLHAAGCFETVQFTDDDRQRAAQYQANAARSAALEAGGSDLAAHLAALDMEAHLAPFDALGRPRIVQLINKTNQFNLTTRRRTDAEVAALEADPAALTLQVRLKDRFGDNGMVGVVIGLRQGDDWLLDTWLMSCRVLNRGVEQVVLDAVVAAARAHGVRRLVGLYLPTPKNALVRDHYPSLGFAPDASDEPGQRWLLDVASYRAGPRPIRVSPPRPLRDAATA